MVKTRRAFSAEFKREAVVAAKKPGNSLAGVPKELGIHDSVLRSWVRQFAGIRRSASSARSSSKSATRA